MNETKPLTIKVSLVASPNGYGFGQDWELFVSEWSDDGRVARINRLWLGQDAKVALRILGTTLSQLADDAEAVSGSRHFGDNNEWLAELIADTVAPKGDWTTLLEAEPWEISAE